jgi:hypothetical protein
MRDDELVDADYILFSGDACAERGPYDIDYTSLPGPSSSSSSHLAVIPMTIRMQMMLVFF